MKNLKDLEPGELLELVTENLATQNRILNDPAKITELTNCKMNIAALQQEIFIRYKSVSSFGYN
jgi:TusA-related sulfurtransferase